MSHVGRMSKCVLANYRYEKDKAIATYLQETRPVLDQNHRDRQNTDENWKMDEDIKHVARIPMVDWLKIQAMGIDQDPVAIRKFLEVKAGHLKTTKKRLI